MENYIKDPKTAIGNLIMALNNTKEFESHDLDSQEFIDFICETARIDEKTYGKILSDVFEIELNDKTPVEDELETAIQDIKDCLEEFIDDSATIEFEDIYKVPFEQVHDNDALIEKIARESTRISDEGVSWDSARNQAMDKVLGDYKLELLGLPENCYGILPGAGDIIIIVRGESGYYRTGFSSDDKEFNKELVDEYNEKSGVSKAQASAMFVGSMFGWDVPGADPTRYDELGALKQESAEKPLTLKEQIATAEKTVTGNETNSIDSPTNSKDMDKDPWR